MDTLIRGLDCDRKLQKTNIVLIFQINNASEAFALNTKENCFRTNTPDISVIKFVPI